MNILINDNKTFSIFDDLKIENTKEQKLAVSLFNNFDITGAFIGDYIYTVKLRKTSKEEIVSITKSDKNGNLIQGLVVPANVYRNYRENTLKSFISSTNKITISNDDDKIIYIDNHGNWYSPNSIIDSSELPIITIIG